MIRRQYTGMYTLACSMIAKLFSTGIIFCSLLIKNYNVTVWLGWYSISGRLRDHGFAVLRADKS